MSDHRPAPGKSSAHELHEQVIARGTSGPTGLGDESYTLAERTVWVWAQVAQVHPEFKRSGWVHDDNPYAVDEIVVNNCYRVTIKPDDRVLDVGANSGVFTALCALNGAVVTAYEPNLGAFSLLEETIRRNGIFDRVIAINKAVASRTGVARYRGCEDTNKKGYRHANGEVEEVPWSLCNGTLMESPWEEKRVVETVSFDEAIGDCEWDCVKLDVEGLEFELLLSASENSLRNIRYLTVELHNGYVGFNVYQKLLARLDKFFVLDFVPDGDPNFSAEGRMIALFGTQR